jgi:cytochrome c oxidase cbb3-type subunit 3
MIMRSNNKTSLILVLSMLFFPTIVFAASTDSPGIGNSYNMALISLVSMMLILLFIIGMLANTLSQLAFVLRDRFRKERKDKSIVKTVLLLVALTMPAIQVFATETAVVAEKTEAPVSNTINGIPRNDFYAIMSIIAVEILVIFALVIFIKMLLNAINKKLETAPDASPVTKRSWFWDKLNAAAPIAKERDVLMDHDYDGIQELDNSLPPWWKYGFYLTIVVACVYLYRFHISHDGPSSHEEFVAAMKQAEEEKAAYLAQAGNSVDESNVALLTDPADVAAGKEIFVKTCTPCHLADGGGSVGPNLTDDYWLHGGSIKDVFKSIKYGWQDKGMKSWKDDFSPKQIQQLASFVKSLKGTKPVVAKAPQGDLYIEASTNAPKTDSTQSPADSIKKGKVAAK